MSIITLNEHIKTISIVHNTGRPRIITDKDEIKDISFTDLCNFMNCNCNDTDIKVIYCKFAKKQVSKLIHNTTYSINSSVKKTKDHSLYEITITRNNNKNNNSNMSLFD